MTRWFDVINRNGSPSDESPTAFVNADDAPTTIIPAVPSSPQDQAEPYGPEPFQEPAPRRGPVVARLAPWALFGLVAVVVVTGTTVWASSLRGPDELSSVAEPSLVAVPPAAAPTSSEAPPPPPSVEETEEPVQPTATRAPATTKRPPPPTTRKVVTTTAPPPSASTSTSRKPEGRSDEVRPSSSTKACDDDPCSSAESINTSRNGETRSTPTTTKKKDS